MFFKRKAVEEELDLFDTGDRLIIYNTDQRTVDIVPVTGVTDTQVESIGRYIIPKQDVSVHVSDFGRVYTFEAPQKIVEETERLARLEQSIVLKQITNYKPEEEINPNSDLYKWALIFLLFVAIIAAAF